MADDVMLLQRFLAWWTRNMAVAYVLLGSAVFGVLVFGWYAYGPVTVAHLWGVAHGHHATYHKAALKLPAGWREDDAAARSDLHLERPFAWHAKVATVDVNEFTGKDIDYERTWNTLQSMETIAVGEGNVAAPYAMSAADAARFACLEHDGPDHTAVHVTCLTRDGRYVVRMVGDEDSRVDFAAILDALAGAL